MVTVKEEKEPHPKFGSGIKTGDEAHIPRSLKRPVTYVMRLSAWLQVRAFGKGWGCPAWQRVPGLNRPLAPKEGHHTPYSYLYVQTWARVEGRVA